MGSEMCIRDRPSAQGIQPNAVYGLLNDSFEGSLAAWDFFELLNPCLLYTSDAADERSSVDLGGRRIIKKKTRD